MSTRFPIVRLKPLGHPSKRGRGTASTTSHGSGSGMELRCFASSLLSRVTCSALRDSPIAARVEPTAIPLRGLGGFEHLRCNRTTVQMVVFVLRRRREWDSNPRGASTNALAGRRLKPLGHPSRKTRWLLPPRSHIAPLGIEPRLSGTRIRRVANYTTGHQSHQSDLNRRPRHYE